MPKSETQEAWRWARLLALMAVLFCIVTSGTQTLTWNAMGQLVKITQRSTGTSDYDWSTVYDALGRRVQTVYQPMSSGTASGASSYLHYYYDPQVEFLELGINNNGSREWKVYGPDGDGTYGNRQGIGGVEAYVYEANGIVFGQVNNYFGDTLGRLWMGGAAYENYGLTLGGYGPQPGTGLLGNLIPQWRGHYVDWTGFTISMGARYYEARSGRFLSPDPLGHAASMSLYDYASGDPVNGLDPDGRCANSSYASSSNSSPFGIDQYTLLNGYGSTAFRGTIQEQVAAQRQAEATSMAINSFVYSLPGLNVVRAGLEAVSGRDLITGERIGADRDMASEFTMTLASTAAMFVPLPGAGVGVGAVGEAMVTRSAGTVMRSELSLGRAVVAERGMVDVATAPHAGVLDAIQRGIDVPIPQGTTGIRTMMADISATTGNEVGLLRMTDGSRVMRLGGPDFVPLGEDVQRLIAHTHPSGDLRLSPADIRALSRRNQQSTVLINPQDAYGVRKSASGSW